MTEKTPKAPTTKPPWAPAATAGNTQGDATTPGATQSSTPAQTTPPAAATGVPATPKSPTPPVPPAATAPVVEVADELVDTVTVTVPKAFKLRLDGHKELSFKAGVQEMEREHAEHWYSKANGVNIYKAK
jgi:hypothetical protein